MLRDIFNTYRQAFRIYMRQRTRPRTIEEAEEKRLFFSKCYVVSALLSFWVATYVTYKKDINFEYNKDIPREDDIIHKLSTGPTTVIRFKNFSKVGEVVYTGEEIIYEKEPVQTDANSTSLKNVGEK